LDLDRFQRIRDWFERLSGQDAAASAARLEAEEPDAEVRARVLALLRRDTAGPGVDAPAVRGLLGALMADAPQIGDELDAWTLVRVVGEGGMGTVYEASRSDGHYAQTAALKVLKGLPSPAALAFIARERQILAGLTHPNIARLLDGGATPGGQPWFAMAMQEGVPIDDYCRQRNLDRAAILHLLLPVCDAIAHAHARLVIHCDLKPSNILVDADGRPCVLDFGIARLLDDPGAASQPSSSSLKARAFTPGFASPELEAGRAVTTATDVYSLGRLLECLLDGTLTDPELAAIVTRACADDPAARYATVMDFAADLKARLDNRPVAAMPATFAYRQRTWWRRHWRAGLVAAAFLLMMLGFTVQTMRERDRVVVAEQAALSARDRAEQAEVTARRINAFLQSMLDGANPDAGGGEVPISKLVDAALSRIDPELADQPAAQSEVLASLSRVQRTLGNDDAALATLQRAIAIERGLDRPLVLARHVHALAALQRAGFSSKDATAAAAEAHALYARLPDAPWDERRAVWLLAGATRSAEDLAAGVALLESVLAEQARRDPRGAGMAECLHVLAGVHMQAGNPGEAEPLLRRSLSIRAVDADSPAALLNTQEMLGRALADLGQVDEAESLLRAALDGRRKLQGDDDPNVPWRLAELARVLDNHGRSMAAVPIYREALAIAGRKIGKDSPAYAVMLNGLAMALQRTGDWDRSDAAFREALVIAVRRWGERDAGLATLRFNYARLLAERGDHAGAEALAMPALATRLALRGPGDADVSATRIALAHAACRMGRLDDSRRRLHEQQQAVPEPTEALQGQIAQVEGCLRAAEGDLDGAIQALESAERLRSETLVPDHPQRWLNQLERVALLLQRDRGDDRSVAMGLARDIATAVDAHLVPGAPLRARIDALAEGRVTVRGAEVR
jgi:tetratricopeptide (TPR) repeat protein